MSVNRVMLSALSKIGQAIIASGPPLVLLAATYVPLVQADDDKPASQVQQNLKLPEDVKPNEIAGVVIDSEGKPLAGVLVDAWTWYAGDETTTNEDGVFRLKPRTPKDTSNCVSAKQGIRPIISFSKRRASKAWRSHWATRPTSKGRSAGPTARRWPT